MCLSTVRLMGILYALSIAKKNTTQLLNKLTIQLLTC